MKISVGLIAVICMVACGSRTEILEESGSNGIEDSEGLPSGQLDTVTIETIESRLNQYTSAVMKGDLDSLEGLVSSEVKQRVAVKGSDLAGFQKKMARSLRTNLEQLGVADQDFYVVVTAATQDGSTIVVQAEIDGVALPKPLYFVEEDGAIRYNVLRAGFSNEVPEGAAAATYRTYAVSSTYYKDVTMSCTGNAIVEVKKGHCDEIQDCGRTSDARCADNCGWWSGTSFSGKHDGVQKTKKCDYNTFGEDVRVYGSILQGIQELSIGAMRWTCNDEC